jgi:hypothetical protein
VGFGQGLHGQGGDDFGAEGGDAQSGFVAGDLDQAAGGLGEGSVGDAKALSGLEMLHFDRLGAVEQGADGLDFDVADFSGFAQVEHAAGNAGVFEDGVAQLFVDAGENVAGKQGFCDLLPAVAPADLTNHEQYGKVKMYSVPWLLLASMP